MTIAHMTIAHLTIAHPTIAHPTVHESLPIGSIRASASSSMQDSEIISTLNFYVSLGTNDTGQDVFFPIKDNIFMS